MALLPVAVDVTFTVKPLVDSRDSQFIVGSEMAFQRCIMYIFILPGYMHCVGIMWILKSCNNLASLRTHEAKFLVLQPFL